MFGIYSEKITDEKTKQRIWKNIQMIPKFMLRANIV